jgi:lysozyme
MQINEAGLKLIKHYEGCKLKPYLCPANLWTIGYGAVLYPEQAKIPSTIEGMAKRKAYPLKAEHNRHWSQKEVDDLLKHDLTRFERGVTLYVTVPLRPNEFSALVSFAFNLGNGVLQRSTVRSALLRGDKKAAMESLVKYCRAGGKILRGLQIRRLDEKALFEGK